MKVSEIRKEIYKRQNKTCLWCDKQLTLAQMHMHELIFRSKGGVISLQNSIGLCYDCHFGNKNAHGKRKPQFGVDKNPKK